MTTKDTGNDIVERLKASCNVREAALLRNLAVAEIERLRLMRAEDTGRLYAMSEKHIAAEARAEQAERERDEALQHEGEKDARIDELLAYLRYDPETQSHFDWVGGYEQAERDALRWWRYVDPLPAECWR